MFRPVHRSSSDSVASPTRSSHGHAPAACLLIVCAALLAPMIGWSAESTAAGDDAFETDVPSDTEKRFITPAGRRAPAAWRSAETPVRFGPLPARVRNPLYLSHLQPSFDRALVAEPGTLRLSAEIDWANIFDKWSRRVEGGRNRGRIDMETVRPSFQARVGVPGGVELGLEVPLVALTGGIADGVIQGWHGLLGLENGGREKVSNGDFLFDVGIPGEASFVLDRPTGLRLGDITTEVRVQTLRPTRTRPGLVLSAALKLPTGAPNHGVGSGDKDVSLHAVVEHGIGPFAFYGQFGVTVLGRGGPLGPLLAPAAVFGGIAVEAVLTRHWSLVVQIRGGSPLHVGFVHPWLNVGPLGLTVGSRWRVGPVDMAFGMEQDPIAADPSADVVVFYRATVTVR